MEHKLFSGKTTSKITFLLIMLFVLACFSVCAENKTVKVSSSTNINKENRNKVVELAKSLEGKPYKYGTYGPNSFDCSGYVFYVFRTSIAKQLPRTATAIYDFCSSIKDSELEAGDLVFFKTTDSGRISHVGIYIGNNKFISAISDGTETGVLIRSLSDRYWKKTYYGAGRVLPSAGGSSEEEINPELPGEGADGKRALGTEKKPETKSKRDGFVAYVIDGCTCTQECRPCSLLW